ncbi:hypothetical protein [Pseudomonas sp. HN2-3]|uniref:hypothetical protein n=1 Tax=Pseudomonas sp. HN2-3 TaxID=2886360 RepID=UPI001D10E932|nr:hypothetical protein [Pseudomonas sp. HN2-3]UDU78995.1 hypothetical protein LJX93_14405 [Pseudomonas sp. HN2-3]
MRAILLLTTAVTLIGCSTGQNQNEYAANLSDDSPPVFSIAEQNDLIDERLQVCMDFFGVKSAEASKRARGAWSWTLVGLFSGAVIAPALTAANAAANAGMIAGFSGLSGASAVAVNNANALGIGPSSSINGLLAVGAAVREDVATASDVSQPFPVRSAAAGRTTSKCANPYLVANYVTGIGSESIETKLNALDQKNAALNETLQKIQKEQEELKKLRR